MIEEYIPRCRHIEVVQRNLSAEIQSHIDAFLNNGGEIQVLASNVRADFDVEATPVPNGKTVVNTIKCKTCSKKFRAVKRQGAQRKYCSTSCRLASGAAR